MPGAILHSSVPGYRIDDFGRVTYRSRSAIKIRKMRSTFSYRNGDNQYYLPIDGSEAVRERASVSAWVDASATAGPAAWSSGTGPAVPLQRLLVTAARPPLALLALAADPA